jgi:antitoxin component HigA of HigAB toxin-antitoxin module
MTTKTAKRPASGSYLDLVKKFPLRRLASESDYDAAVAVMEPLAVRGEEGLDDGESDYLDALATLVEAFDRQKHPRKPDHRTPAQRLKYLLDQSGTTQRQLAKALKLGEPMVSLILAGERDLSIDSVRALAAYFKINASYFL